MADGVAEGALCSQERRPLVSHASLPSPSPATRVGDAPERSSHSGEAQLHARPIFQLIASSSLDACSQAVQTAVTMARMGARVTVRPLCFATMGDDWRWIFVGTDVRCAIGRSADPEIDAP